MGEILENGHPRDMMMMGGGWRDGLSGRLW